ncbi:hypothetical protein BH10ACT7_BH10ACT7_03030 [soil metagenome]
MCSHMGDAGGLCGCAGGRHSSGGDHVACGTAGDEASTNFSSGTELTGTEGACAGDCISWPIVVWVLGFEQTHNSIRAIRSPQRDEAAIDFA